MVKIKKFIDKFLEFVLQEKKSPHYDLRKYFHRHRSFRLKSKNTIGIYTFNMQHAKFVANIIINKYKRKIKYYRIDTCEMRIGKTRIVFFTPNREARGYRFNKLIVYSPSLYDDKFLSIIMPMAMYCVKRDVFILPNRQEEKIIDILRQL